LSFGRDREPQACPLLSTSIYIAPVVSAARLLQSHSFPFSLQKREEREREKEPSTALPCPQAFFVIGGEGRGTERAEDHMVAFFWVCDSFCLWSFSASFSLLMT